MVLCAIARQLWVRLLQRITDAKLMHALGFEQLIPDYLDRAGADSAEIARHQAFLAFGLDDRALTVSLYRNTRYVAVEVG